MKTLATRRLTPLHNLKYSYILAFSVIVLILLGSQALNQYALYRGGVARAVAALESRQAVRSQRLGRNAVLFLAPGSHAATIKEMQNDLAGMEADRLLLNARYIGDYPQFRQIDHGHGLAIYLLVRNTALDLIRLDGLSYPSDKARLQAESADITTLFYKEQEQLQNIQAAQGMVDKDIDAYIASVRTIDLASFALSVVVILFEGLVVLPPALRLFSAAYAKETTSSVQVEPVPPEPVL